jgi:DNA mismatch repair ATPase MutS
MKAFLMYKDRDFDLQANLPWNEQALTQDLELGTLFKAMAHYDKFVLDVARKAVLSCLSHDVDTIRYRQNILKDCLKDPAIVTDIYDIAVEAIESEKKVHFGIFASKSPMLILYRSIDVLQILVPILKRLQAIAAEQVDRFESEGFTRLFAMLNEELGEEYFASIDDHLRTLKFRDGVLISAELRKGNKGANYVLRKPKEENRGWIQRIFGDRSGAYTLHIADRDEGGARALSELKDRGINLVANALAQSTDHILNFFSLLRIELAFYVGCLSLHEQLVRMGEPTSFPQPVAPGDRGHSFKVKGLYDVCLALAMRQKVVGNDVSADDKELMIITGANQGGKSTFLRSIGLSQLMMQCGMFVPAESFCSTVCDGLFTLYKREEDVSLKSGKLDEELNRMSDIVDNLTSYPLLLFNEAFAATTEREGSEIARQIVRALLERRIKVCFVTHLYDFAHAFHERQMERAIFLRAERQADGARTFKLIEGEPLQTSYGGDLYMRIFG